MPMCPYSFMRSASHGCGQSHPERTRPGIDPQTTRFHPGSTRKRPAPDPQKAVAQKPAAKAGQGGSIGHAVAGLGG